MTPPPTIPLVGIIMGSQSDWATMKEAALILDQLGVAHEAKIVSAHRTPDRLWDYGKMAAGRGLLHYLTICASSPALYLAAMTSSGIALIFDPIPAQPNCS